MGSFSSTRSRGQGIEHFCRNDTPSRSCSRTGFKRSDRKQSVKYKKILTNKVTNLRNSLKNVRIQTTSFSDFIVVGYLGGGAFGQVLKVQHKISRVSYALKVQSKEHIIKSRNQLERLMNEKHILAATDYVFIVRLFSTFKDNACVYLVLELVPCGDFFDLKEKYRHFNEDMTRFYSGQVLLSFEYLHAGGIIYRDLKPENLLVAADGYLKLTDFGYAKPLKNVTYTFCGTPEYMAPEVFTKRGYTQSVDYWTLGILLYEILYQTTPFYARSTEAIYDRIQNETAVFPLDSRVTTDAHCVITRLLQKDLTKRLGVLRNGADDVKDHPWFSGMNWMALYERRYPAPLEPAMYSPKSFDLKKLPHSPVVLYEQEFKKF
ncbi:cAMP-dependent protein kinase catalytic subunit alpha-like [Varroa jacobsoni]|uniref:Uncharacterized protein n=1 Tax=Varroa destructor TaxID=109461 RepID=A0A7M7KBI5_VARDE|nr:cAMP-dependent protein kinase catalytic subunit alpha-like [Varroa destructor]XP_022703405.1 cAMP-dependent protein kinase catalytic subunit alpha-like [Varroa jacobsoni]